MASSLLCETVTGRDVAELVAARDGVTAADMVELRLDGVAHGDVARALQGRRIPVIVTCRPVWEGGRFAGSEEERLAVLTRALELGAEYVDVEWEALRPGSGQALRHAQHAAGFDDLVQRHRTRVIVSSHDFAGVPRDLATRVRAMRGTGAAVIKVAITATRLTDTLPLLEIAREGPAVVIGMGDAGVPSRLLAARFGSHWTYAGNSVAPGQVPVQRMVEQFRFRAVGPGTAIYGVVGDNAMRAMSPAMHNAAFAAAGIDAVSVPLRAADFADFLTFADALGIAGVSVTIPFTIDALHASASADELTRAVGAANTLRRCGPAEAGPYVPNVEAGSSYVGAGFSRPGGREWEATNTDVEGFLEPLDAIAGADLRRTPNAQLPTPSDWELGIGSWELSKVRPYNGLRVSVLGAGGAARAVVVALRSRGARVTVHVRRTDRAQEVASGLNRKLQGVQVGPWPPVPGSWDVLVNCTPLGSASAREESPLPGGPFGGRLVYDLTYGSAESPLLREARLAGCATLDGLPMIMAQAERQFEWWTGRRAPAGVMRAAVFTPTGHGDTEAGRSA